MKLSEFKQHLTGMQTLQFIQADGSLVPAHFHITEVGLVTKHYIDCGGTVRTEKAANFQIWVANDTHHRLAPAKLLSIIDISKTVLGDEDPEVEAEYQMDTIGRFDIGSTPTGFVLIPKYTNCLAQDQCGIPPEMQPAKRPAFELVSSATGVCTPGSGCC